MKLQGRNLELNMRGEDVALLRKELEQLKFQIVDTPENLFGSTTLIAVQDFQKQHNLPATGVVDADTAGLINATLDAQPREGYLVKGRVMHGDGRPAARAGVVLFEKRLRSERTLGKDSTDLQGMFAITYPKLEETPLSVLVRGNDPDGQEIAVSDLICDVKPVEEVTLVVGGEALRGPSEYGQLEEFLRPALAAEYVDPADLNEEDVNLLACKFALNPEHVALFVVSARHHRETDIAAEGFYGLLRQGLSTDLTTLVSQSQDTLRGALETSIEGNIINPQLQAAIPRILEELQNQIVRLALRDPEPDRPTFAAVFEIAGVDSRHRKRILEDYVKREGTVEDYWKRLRDDPEISNEVLDELQDTLELSTIALNHVALVSHLARLRRSGAIGPQLRDLSRLQPAEWREILETETEGRKIGAPEFFGKDEEERIDRYAEFLPRMVESIFPTAALTHRLAEIDDGEFDFGPALSFLNRNPDFEFRDTLVQTYLDEHPDALTGIPDAENTIGTLRGMQRLFQIAPAVNRAPAVARLMAQGIDSATAIRRVGATQFIRQNRGALGFEGAQETYTRAARKADTALFLLSRSLVFNPTNPAIMAPHLLGQGVPDLEDLFGSLDLCKCEHCNSIYGPAAYLVDILHYLMNRPTVSGGRTALDVLFDRRPDLGEVELNCHNTNTVLPYVDLVLEILETAVVSGGTLTIVEEEDEDRFFPFQTVGEADALGANPEHLNEQAYEIVRNAVYPWLLPFDLWSAEVRIYLNHLGIAFHELMTQFNFAEPEESAAVIAAEYLGLTPREREIITDSGSDPLHALWGFDNEGELNLFVDNRNAARLLDRSELTYEELSSLLTVRYIDPTGNLGIQFEGADCNLDTAIITNLNDGALDRIHRFVRLSRRQSWAIAELGAILETLDADDLDDELLVQLAAVTELHRELKAPLPVLLNWLADRMPTVADGNEPSLYEQVFLDPAVHKPELAIFSLNPAGTELADPTASLNDHVPITYSALGISAPDLILLIDTELPDTTLNLPNLTRLYQTVSLSKRLGVSISEYVSLRGLSGIDPFGTGAIDRTPQFVKWVRRLQETPFTIAQIDYLLRHRQTDANPIDPAEEEVTTTLATLRAGVYQIALDHTSAESGDAILQMAQDRLALMLPGDVTSQIMAIINGTSNRSQEDQITLIEDELAIFLDPAEVITAWFEGESAAPSERANIVLAPLLQHLRRVTSENFIVQTIASAHGIELSVADQLLRTLILLPDSDESALAIFMADGFVPPISDTGPLPDFQETTTFALFPQQFGTYQRLAKIALVIGALKVPDGGIEYLFTEGVAAGWPDLNALPLEPLEEPAVELATLLSLAELFQAANSLFGDISTLFELLRSLEDDDMERASFLESVASLSGWESQDLTFLTGSSALDLTFPDEFRDGQFLVQLRLRFRLLRELPVSAESAHQWAIQPVTVQTAQAVKQAARAKYQDKAQWLTVAKPLRDELREQQRAAMVAYLVHNIRIQVPRFEEPQPNLSLGRRRPAVLELQLKLNIAGAVPTLKVDGIFGQLTRQAVRDFQEAHGLDVDGIVGPITWANLNAINRHLEGPNELYAHFLIDVEMDPCMLTSRIVLAHGSVQLFMQRCLLNLEPEVQLSPEDAKEWEWMKRYRVWEANRKVFLYPENWIYPELRDDKTPIFKELENGLLQDEINEATIEREYLKYLNGLNQIAQLEISGIYRQWEVDRDILHVVARTQNAPRTYYYRTWVDQRYWTAWEKVDVDIEGDHLVPVVWNRRLYLFWPIFEERDIEKEKADEIKRKGKDEFGNFVEITETVETKEILRYYEIRIAWSEFREGRWSSKQLSDTSIITSHEKKLTPKNEYSFWPQFDSQNRLYIFNDPHFFEGPFRFESCDGKPAIRKGSAAAKRRLAFPGTRSRFDKLKEKSNGNARLEVFTEGRSIPMVDREIFSDFKSTVILAKTPGKFEVVLPSSERHFISRSPFVYSDQRRTFVVIPRGTYSGGFSDPDLGLVFELNRFPVPLELPDTVARSVAAFVTANAGESLTSEMTDNDAPNTPVGILLSPVVAQVSTLAPLHWQAKGFRFESHYHPYVCLLIEELNRYGIDGIFRPDPEKEKTAQHKAVVKSLVRQKRKRKPFNGTYAPTAVTDTLTPREEFEFDYGGAYSVYNWELFFHAPLMLAKRLSDNQRFAEAHRWFHYMFDPTYRPEDSLFEPWPERVWQIKPFFEHGVGQSIQRTMLLLKSSGLTDEEKKERKDLQDLIEAWRKEPFNPHLIARMRPEAYMKTTVMAYLDNLIAWGDHQFGQDTMESINEATQLYVLAAEILGERPREIAAHENTVRTIGGEEVGTFNDLRGRLDAFSNVLVELESLLEPDASPGNGGGIGSLVGPTELTFALPDDGNGDLQPDLPLASNHLEPPDDNPPVADVPLAQPVPAVLGPTLFFCIPKNDKLLGYWDTIADRLFKIRHCMNIEGVVRQLPLFQPPIDPGLLVKATAAGVDISSVLNDFNAPLPPYRFQTLQQKAAEFTKDVIGLGASLLAALEKRDAEALALLRAGHEIRILESVRKTREQQIKEAEEQKGALEESQTAARFRSSHYAELVSTGLIEGENLQIFLTVLSTVNQALAGASSVEASEIAYNQGDYNTSLGVSVGVSASANLFSAPPGASLGGSLGESSSAGTSWGGTKKSSGTRARAEEWSTMANTQQTQANMLGITSAFFRRQEEWFFQQELADKDVLQLAKQIEAAKIRIELAKNELKGHDTRMENAKEVDEYMRSKYTNQELYNWMVPQISAIYFQSYKLAYDLAKRAERAFQYELGQADASYIQFGYWDSLKKGLLSGEKLHHDLKRLDVAYLEGNRREFELTKHASLAILNPLALLQLKEEGRCQIELPEALFDLDYPGHYFRRIKSVTITIPAVTGPYTTLSCTLRLLRSSIRRQSTLLSGQYVRDLENDDPRFSDSFGAIQSIAISSGQNDSGLFEFNFRDERYLPFEGAGAISRWQLEMPDEFRQFDYDSIADVVLHIKYTAREGGEALRLSATENLNDGINALVTGDNAPGLHQHFSARHEFPTEFHRFLHPAGEAEPQTLALNLAQNRFPYMFQGRTIIVDQVHIFVRLADEIESPDLDGIGLVLSHPGGEAPVDPGAGETIGNVRRVSIGNLDSEPGEWSLTASNESNPFDPDVIEEIVFILHYTVA